MDKSIIKVKSNNISHDILVLRASLKTEILKKLSSKKAKTYSNNDCGFDRFISLKNPNSSFRFYVKKSSGVTEMYRSTEYYLKLRLVWLDIITNTSGIIEYNKYENSSEEFFAERNLTPLSKEQLNVWKDERLKDFDPLVKDQKHILEDGNLLNIVQVDQFTLTLILNELYLSILNESLFQKLPIHKNHILIRLLIPVLKYV